MATITKKNMLEDYPALKQRADLLELYLYDTQTGRQPDAVESYSQDGDYACNVSIQLWRASHASGGYVVVKEVLPNIWLLDDALIRFGESHSHYNAGIRICLDRLRVIRNRMLDAKS